jgi:hypothetical protein
LQGLFRGTFAGRCKRRKKILTVFALRYKNW